VALEAAERAERAAASASECTPGTVAMGARMPIADWRIVAARPMPPVSSIAMFFSCLDFLWVVVGSCFLSALSLSLSLCWMGGVARVRMMDLQCEIGRVLALWW